MQWKEQIYVFNFFFFAPSIVKAGVSSENRDDRQDGLGLSQTGSEDGLMGQMRGTCFRILRVVTITGILI